MDDDFISQTVRTSHLTPGQVQLSDQYSTSESELDISGLIYSDDNLRSHAIRKASKSDTSSKPGHISDGLDLS